MARFDPEFGARIARRGTRGALMVFGLTVASVAAVLAIGSLVLPPAGGPLLTFGLALVPLPIGLLLLIRQMFIRTTFYETGLVHRTLFSSRRIAYRDIQDAVQQLRVWRSRGSETWTLYVLINFKVVEKSLALRLPVAFDEPAGVTLRRWTGAAEQDAWVDPVFVAMEQLCKVAGIPNERLWPD